jgi:hypothetical protein
MNVKIRGKSIILSIFGVLFFCSSCTPTSVGKTRSADNHKERAKEHHNKMWKYDKPMWDETPSHSRVPMDGGPTS